MRIGIDFGTSTCSVSYLNSSRVPTLIKCSTGIGGNDFSIPTAVFVNQDGSLLVGQAAIHARSLNPANFRKEFKRNIGENVPFMLAGCLFLPEDLCKHILIHLKGCAEKMLDQSISGVTLCHPANFGQHKIDLLVRAAKKAGFSSVECLDEPTAAAIYYQNMMRIGESLIVYDFGGGTFDVALMEKTAAGYKPLTKSLGIEECGGADFDVEIYENLIATIRPEMEALASKSMDYLYRFQSDMEQMCIMLKHQLSVAQSHTIRFNLPGSLEYNTYTLAKDSFERLIEQHVIRTITLTGQIIKNAGLSPERIHKVLLVGGSSRVPLIRSLLTQEFGNRIMENADPDWAICYGAAIGHVRPIDPLPPQSPGFPLADQLSTLFNQKEFAPSKQEQVEPLARLSLAEQINRLFQEN